jgi:chemotaxis protein MotB
LQIREKEAAARQARISQLAQGIEVLVQEQAAEAQKSTRLESLLAERDARLLETDDKLAALSAKLAQSESRLATASQRIASLAEEARQSAAVGSETRQKADAFEKTVAENESLLAKCRQKVQEETAARKTLQEALQRAKGALHAVSLEKEEQTRADSETIVHLKATYAELKEEFKSEIDRREAVITELKKKLSVTLVQDVLFEFGQTALAPGGRQKLKRIGNILQKNGSLRIVVAGHSDNVPIASEYRDRFPTNWELSAARAASVVRYFQYACGIDPMRMEAVGHSFYKPIDDHTSEAGRARNRRVEIFLSPHH